MENLESDKQLLKRERDRQYARQYRIDHKQQVQEYARQYRMQNKQNKQLYDRQHYETNGWKKRLYNIEHKEAISERAKEIVTCECGCEISRINIARHRRSQKHLNKLENQSNWFK